MTRLELTITKSVRGKYWCKVSRIEGEHSGSVDTHVFRSRLRHSAEAHWTTHRGMSVRQRKKPSVMQWQY